MSMRKIYREVAKKHGVSVKEVKEEMQKALDHAYSNTADDGVIVAYQKQVPSKGDILFLPIKNIRKLPSLHVHE